MARAPGRWEIDFNSAADRIRVVADHGANLRLHHDTGALAATDVGDGRALWGIAIEP